MVLGRYDEQPLVTRSPVRRRLCCRSPNLVAAEGVSQQGEADKAAVLPPASHEHLAAAGSPAAPTARPAAQHRAVRRKPAVAEGWAAGAHAPGASQPKKACVARQRGRGLPARTAPWTSATAAR